MGLPFFNWLDNNPTTPPKDVQLTLEGQEEVLPEKPQRVDGAIVNRKFNAAIKRAGGTGKVYAEAVIAETEELFDCSVDELYQNAGATPGRRETLPEDAQGAYMTAEFLAAQQLNHAEFEGTPTQKNKQITNTVRTTAKQVRKWLPW